MTDGSFSHVDLESNFVLEAVALLFIYERDAVLQHLEVVIETASFHKVFVSPPLNYASPVDDDDLIRPPDCGQPVRDNDARPVCHDCADCLFDQHFRLCIHI